MRRQPVVFVGQMSGCVAVTLCAALASAQTGEGSTSVEVAARVMSGVPPHQIRYRAAYSLELFGTDHLASVERSPGVVAIADDESGRAFHIIEECVLDSDGRGSLAIRTRSLLHGGRPEFATQVEIWSGESHATIPPRGALAKIHDFAPLSTEEMVGLHAQNRRLAIEDRAQLSYFEMMRYMLTAATACGRNDVTGDRATETLSAACLGATFTLGDGGATLRRATLGWPDGNVTELTYDGFRPLIPGVLHPTRIRIAKTQHFRDQGRTETSVRLVLIDSMSGGTSPKPDVFAWQTYADSAFNARSGEVILADGSLDPAMTRQVSAAAPPPTGPTPPRGADGGSGRSSTFASWVLVVSLASLIGAGVIWWRRRG